MKGLKNFLQSLFFILFIVVLGGFLLPSTQKVEKTIVIKAPPEEVMKCLNKKIDSLGIAKKELSGKIIYTSTNGQDTLSNEAIVTPVKEGCEYTRITLLNAGSNIFKKYSLLVNRQVEEGKVREEMILIKLECEKK